MAPSDVAFTTRSAPRGVAWANLASSMSTAQICSPMALAYWIARCPRPPARRWRPTLPAGLLAVVEAEVERHGSTILEKRYFLS